MKKEEIRSIFKEKRTALTQEEIEISTRKIHDLLFSRIMIHRFSPIHLFLPIKRNNEPHLDLFVNTLRKDFVAELFISKTLPPNNLFHFKFNASTKLVTNTWGIEEPFDDGSGLSSEDFFKEYAKEDILIIVPLLAFDKSGQRVGYGKGYYDRFLEFKTKDTTVIGISLFEPIEQITDSNSLDIPMNFCITPQRVWSF